MIKKTNASTFILSSAALICIVFLLSVQVSFAETLVVELDGGVAQTASKEAPKVAQTGTKPVQRDTSKEVRLGSVGEVSANIAQIHHSTSTTSKVYSSVPQKTSLAIIAQKNGWYGVLMANGATGWVESGKVAMLDYDIVTTRETTSRSGAGVRDSERDLLHNDIIRTAFGYTGVKYVFGGENPNTGLDCSAFVRLVFSKFNTKLPRTARAQAAVGKTIPFDRLQPGDRLYFACNSKQIDHCGIYAGDGYFIHCSSGKKGVTFDSLASDFYWNGLVVAKR